MITRRKPPDSRIERQIIQGLITSERFIKEIKPILTIDSLSLPFTKSVALWCLDFFDNHGTAPGKVIQDIFIEKRKRDLDDDQATLIEDFLTSISDEYERQETFNVSYYLKKAETHLRSASLQNLSREITRAVTGGRIEEAEALAKGYERISRPQARGVDPINDTKFLVSLFDENINDQLFSLHGAIGRTMGPFERGHLFAIVGAQKAGKSWWLMLTALRALFAGYNVIFISLEMSEKQMGRRIQHYINGLPTRRWAGEMLIPIFDCEKNQKGTCKKSKRTSSIDLIKGEDNEFPHFDDAPKKYKPCTECMGSRDFICTSWFKKTTKEELTIERVLKKKQAMKRSAMIRGSKFHLVGFASGTLTMSELRAYLYNLEQYDNFVPDVIITDYADKMKPEHHQDHRHGINEIWEGHKGLAQEKNALVATGSQSNTVRTGKRIGQGDWADDIRKLGLVDESMALNMTPEQKQRGIMECSMIAQRHEFSDILQSCIVLHQLKIGRPYIASY